MTNATCPECGAPIPPDAPHGGCPACLLAAGLAPVEAAATGPTAPDPAQIERLFPQFEVHGLIGRGGMGIVYRARQRSLDRPVALKLLPPDVSSTQGFAERFRREARALASLSHPNIVAVYEAVEAQGHFALAMEYVDGVNLRQAQEAGGITPAEALAVVPQICDALQYAHDRGVVHRDIKPENILLTRDGAVKIADFGLAKLLRRDPGDVTLTGTAQVMGTFHYLAPEQMRTPKDVDHRADIYALGVVFYELLTGELPLGRFPAPSERVQVDVRLDAVVLRALERERDLRYQHASEIKTGIESLHGTPPPAPASGDLSTPTSPTSLSRLALAGVLCLPLALLVGLVVYALGARDETAVLAGSSVVVLGVIFAVIARSEIRRAPQRWYGLTLTRWTIRLPVVTAVLAGIALAVMLVTQRDLRESSRREAARAAIEMTARTYVAQLDARREAGASDPPLALIDPARRAYLTGLAPEELHAEAEAGRLGLALLPASAIGRPLAEFDHIEVRFTSPDTAEVTAIADGESLVFGMVRDHGTWYLSVAPATHARGRVPDNGR